MLTKKPRVIRYDGNNDEEFYRRRVLRNGCFLGVDAAQQAESQQKLAKAVVGVAGAGGLGSNLAMQLARMGVRHIKIGDPDHFEETNINRQFGAGANTIGKNKALVVGDMIREVMPDVTVEIFPEGLQRHTAREFVNGTDLLFDCTDFYLVDERYALHRAYREQARTKTLYCAMVWGWGCAIYKFARAGMTFEELIGLPEGEDLTPEKIDVLVRMQANRLPRFPSRDFIYSWMAEVGNIPILGAVVPIAIGFLAAQATLSLCDLDQEPYSPPFPPIPQYFWIDALDLSSGIHSYDGQWVNPDVFKQHFPEHV